MITDIIITIGLACISLVGLHATGSSGPAEREDDYTAW